MSERNAMGGRSCKCDCRLVGRVSQPETWPNNPHPRHTEDAAVINLLNRWTRWVIMEPGTIATYESARCVRKMFPENNPHAHAFGVDNR